MNANDLFAYLQPIIAACPLWSGQALHAVLIANPAAGGFTRKKYAQKHEQCLKSFSEQAKARPAQCAALTGEVYETEGAGGTKSYVQRIIREAGLEENAARRYLLVTAGGDGTSLEVQAALAQVAFSLGGEYADVVKNRIAVLRLPFGTGNDGSDGRTLEESLARLAEPAHFALQRAVSVNCANAAALQSAKREESLSEPPPWYSFNIASVGIDAFITHMTNRTKNVFPGDFYKLWIDLACLFYGFLYKPGTAKITAFNAEGASCEPLQTKIEFCVLGVSGRRTYGSNQRVLPDERNMCVARKMNLLAKLAVKGKIKKGRHSGDRRIILACAEKLEIEYDQPILVQLDGEVHLLRAENFPIVMEKTEPVIRIIENDDAVGGRRAMG